MHFIYNNIAVICVAVATSLMGWLYGGTRADILADVVPWLLLFMIQVMFIFPQKHKNESTYDAHERVWRSMKRDPLFWISFGFLLLLAIPFINTGLCTSCDRLLIAQGIKPDPPVKFLPFCVNRFHHLNVFFWFALSLSAMIVTKHGLTKSGKRRVLEMIVWNGFALAILGFVQSASGAVGPLWQKMTNVTAVSTFFSTFGYPNMAGDYFTTLCGISVALWRYHYDDAVSKEKAAEGEGVKVRYRLFWRRHLYLIPAGICAFAAVSTLSRAAIILISCVCFVSFLHSVFDMTHSMHKKDRVRTQMVAVIAMMLITFFTVISMPDEVQSEMGTVDATEVLTRISGKGQYHTRVATAVWRDNMLFGCGGWGYKHFCIPKMTPEELKEIQSVGGINVHNDYLQLLAEHGLVGLGFIVVIVLMLLKPIFQVWAKLVKSARFLKGKKAPPKPIHIFALPASAFFILLTATATFIHGFGDCPFRSPAVMTLFFVSLAAVPGFLPKETTDASR